MVKPFSGAEVVARIRAVLRRSRGRAGGRGARSWLGDLARRPGRAPRRRSTARELALSRKEFDLLAELARDAGRVVTREELMADVWDENWFGSTKTLDVHVGLAARASSATTPPTPRYLAHGPRASASGSRAPEE